MTQDKSAIKPAEGVERKFEITDDGKLAKSEEADEADFEEDLTFDE